ncbi:hypothetical protein WA026_000143 [Henosepilachna vigintioctopunctata]
MYLKTITLSGFVLRKNSPRAIQRYSSMIRPKVYVTRIVDDEAMDILKKHCDVTAWSGTDPVPPAELEKNIAQVDGLFCVLTDKINKKLLGMAKNLKVISTMSVGYDHLDINEIKKRGIRVGYTPDILTDSTAELTIGLLLATSRRLIEANTAAKVGHWQTWSPFWMCGIGLKNATVGFFGFGRIGQEIARRLKTFKIKEILYTSRSAKKEAEEIGASKVNFNDLLKHSDFLIVACSFNEDTKEIFNMNAFRNMKKNAVLINSSRGGVVKQDDLVKALEEKVIWGAGLDVTTPEPLPPNHVLFKLDNCVILPHIGSATTDCRKEMSALTANNIVAVLNNQQMPSELHL